MFVKQRKILRLAILISHWEIDAKILHLKTRLCTFPVKRERYLKGAIFHHCWDFEGGLTEEVVVRPSVKVKHLNSEWNQIEHQKFTMIMLGSRENGYLVLSVGDFFDGLRQMCGERWRLKTVSSWKKSSIVLHAFWLWLVKFCEEWWWLYCEMWWLRTTSSWRERPLCCSIGKCAS